MHIIDPQSSISDQEPVDEVLLTSENPLTAYTLPIEEINGPKGPEPTRYGDWERKGRCIDF